MTELRDATAADAATGFDPFASDASRWATSMRNHGELLTGMLEAANVRSIVEVGAYAGDLTSMLLDWADRHGATVGAVDPMPQPQLVTLAESNPALDLIREPSLEALARIPIPDAVVIDGDHNWHTVIEELRLIAARAEELPLLLFHDVCWPHARRDDYYSPDAIPADLRQPLVPEGHGIMPGIAGTVPAGMPYPKSAAHEGGERNGVRTAVEDFVAEQELLRFVAVPIFFGLGVVWRLDAPYSEALAAMLDPWDDNPTIARLEANRVHHLATGWALQQRLARQEALLDQLRMSRSFTVAERLSRIYSRVTGGRGETAVTKDEIRRALAD
ncbi:MAG: class I SAM-dependent methyltransferase [Baekduia sp.]